LVLDSLPESNRPIFTLINTEYGEYRRFPA